MEVNGHTFIPKSGHLLLIWVKICLKKLAFCYILSQWLTLHSVVRFMGVFSFLGDEVVIWCGAIA